MENGSQLFHVRKEGRITRKEKGGQAHQKGERRAGPPERRKEGRTTRKEKGAQDHQKGERTGPPER